MPISPYDTAAAPRYLRLIWSCLDLTRKEIKQCLTLLPAGSSLLVKQKDVAWLRKQAPRCNLLCRGTDGIERLRHDNSLAETMALYAHCLPSQVLPSQIRDHQPRATVALDIVLCETTEEAWEEADRLIENGLPSQVVASALIGSPSDVAQRLNDYRALGIRDVILEAPFNRLPVALACSRLIPLLQQQSVTVRDEVRITGISHDLFEWHGAAL